MKMNETAAVGLQPGTLAARLRATLAERRNPDGGVGVLLRQGSRLKPTCWANLAWLRPGQPSGVERAALPFSPVERVAAGIRPAPRGAGCSWAIRLAVQVHELDPEFAQNVEQAGGGQHRRGPYRAARRVPATVRDPIRRAESSAPPAENGRLRWRSRHAPRRQNSTRLPESVVYSGFDQNVSG